MGKMFGNLAHISGIITYSLSPFEQRAFAGAISHGIPNMWFRFRSQALRVLPRKYKKKTFLPKNLFLNKRQKEFNSNSYQVL